MDSVEWIERCGIRRGDHINPIIVKTNRPEYGKPSQAIKSQHTSFCLPLQAQTAVQCCALHDAIHSWYQPALGGQIGRVERIFYHFDFDWYLGTESSSSMEATAMFDNTKSLFLRSPTPDTFNSSGIKKR